MAADTDQKGAMAVRRRDQLCEECGLRPVRTVSFIKPPKPAKPQRVYICEQPLCGNEAIHTGNKWCDDHRTIEARQVVEPRPCRECGVPVEGFRRLCPDHGGFVPSKADYAERLHDLIIEYDAVERWAKDGEEGWADLMISEVFGGAEFSEGTRRLVSDLVRVGWDDGDKKRSGPKPDPSSRERLHRMKVLFPSAFGIERPVGDVWRALDVDSGRQIAASKDRAEIVSTARKWGEEQPEGDYRLIAA